MSLKSKYDQIVDTRHTNEKMSLKKLASIDKTIATDASFERPYGWSKKTTNEYLQSVFNLMANAPITIVDVRACMKHSIAKGFEPSVEYFSTLNDKEGTEYISIDGKHRRRAIEQFINNKVAFTGNVPNLDGIMEKYRNVYFKDLTAEQQARVGTIQISVDIYKAISRSQLNEVFNGLNSGNKASEQCLRNCYYTRMSKKTRDLHDKYSYMKKLYNDIDRLEMLPEQDISKMILHLTEVNKKTLDENFRFSHLESKNLDAFYKEGEAVDTEECYQGLPFEQVYDVIAYRQCDEILGMFQELAFKLKLKGLDMFKKNNILLLFLAFEKVLKSEYEIEDYVKFYQNISPLDSQMKALGAGIWGKTEMKKANTYDGWKEQTWKARRMLRQNALWEGYHGILGISQNPEAYGLVKKVEEISEENEAA